MGEPTREAPPLSAEIIGAIVRASARSAAVVHEDMKEGLNSLATIACIAPWLGLFGTLLGIANSFVGFDGPKDMGLAILAGRLSGSMWTAASGILVGLTSLWGYRYLTGSLEDFEREMESASFDLINQLARYRGRWKLGPTIEPAGGPYMFGAKSPGQMRQDQRFWYRSIFLTGAALVVGWCLQVVRYFEHDYLPLGSAPWAACKYVLFVFGVSCIPAYVLWVKVLCRRRVGFADLASALCLCWSVAELVLGVHLP